MDRMTLVNMLRTNRQEFEGLIAKLSRERMENPLDEEHQLTGKDIVAHVTAWEQRLISWIQASLRGETPQIPEPGYTLKQDEIDALNHRTFARDKQRSLPVIMDAYHASFQQLLAQIEKCSDEDLFTRDRFAWLNGGTLGQGIAMGAGYRHFQDHFYDLILRLEPADRFTPDDTIMQTYAGTYNRSKRQMSFRIADGTLMIRQNWRTTPQEAMPGLALDNARFAYSHFGLVTFHPAADGSVSACEWWTLLFQRVEE